jgi:hypothetical protein
MDGVAASAPASAAAAARAADLAAASLAHVVATYGLGVCGDPWRCEALLRDLCPGGRREVFWLIAALKENIVVDIKSAPQANSPNPAANAASEAALTARLAHKLADGLGLAEAPAQWTAQTWLQAVRSAPPAAAAPDLAHVARTDLPAWPTADEISAGTPAPLPAVPPGIDARWLGLCAAGVLAPLLALAAIARVALFPSGTGPRGWVIDTALLAAGLGCSALTEFGVTHALARWRPRRRPSPSQAPWALLPEIGALLAQPTALILVPALWLGEWLGQWRYFGQSHDFAFHLGRALQTILVALFLVKWTKWMTIVQGRIAATLVRPR